MKISLAILILLMSACKGSSEPDDRDFASARFSKLTEATIQGEAEVIAENIPAGDLEKELETEIAKDVPKENTETKIPPGPPPPPPPFPEPKIPELPPKVKDKLAKCYPQWEKIIWEKDTLISIREFKIETGNLQHSKIQLSGDKPEVVFVSMLSTANIEHVVLSLENPKALYCVEIEAAHLVKSLNIDFVCGAKLGLVDIEAGKAKNLSIREVCNKPVVAP